MKLTKSAQNTVLRLQIELTKSAQNTVLRLQMEADVVLRDFRRVSYEKALFLEMRSKAF